jgi:chlorite dismutase
MSDTRRRPPTTEEGWYVLHDLRRIDWEGWRGAPAPERERALQEGVDHLQRHQELSDADAGGSAVFSMLGHKADLMIVHMRPATAQLDRAERRFEQTAFAGFTERVSSYVSVTEISGYMTENLEDGLDAIEDAGRRNYMQSRLYPSIPEAAHVCFYPMDKRRGPEFNWYDLSFADRQELIESHGEIGREFAGKVTQIISGSTGLDDHEWGVTLFADDATQFKQLLTAMRFDPSSSRYAEFGSFYVGRRMAPTALDAFMAGETIEAEPAEEEPGGAPPQQPDGPPHEEIAPPELESRIEPTALSPTDAAGYGLVFYTDATAEAIAADVEGLSGNFDNYDTHVGTALDTVEGQTMVTSLWANERAATVASGFLSDIEGVTEGVGGPLESQAADGSSSDTGTDAVTDDGELLGTGGEGDIRGALSELDIYAGQPHGEDIYAMVVYSEAHAEQLAEAVATLRESFERYDTHVQTSLYESRSVSRTAVVSLWETESAATTAGDYLADLPEVVDRAGQESGFGTMGMFYTVLPEYREEFVGTFEEVGELLAGMDGHQDTQLMVNQADENDMFISSQWAGREDAMAFFRADAFRETVQWGREVLADQPRHVFLA